MPARGEAEGKGGGRTLLGMRHSLADVNHDRSYAMGHIAVWIPCSYLAQRAQRVAMLRWALVPVALLTSVVGLALLLLVFPLQAICW